MWLLGAALSRAVQPLGGRAPSLPIDCVKCRHQASSVLYPGLTWYHTARTKTCVTLPVVSPTLGVRVIFGGEADFRGFSLQGCARAQNAEHSRQKKRHHVKKNCLGSEITEKRAMLDWGDGNLNTRVRCLQRAPRAVVRYTDPRFTNIGNLRLVHSGFFLTDCELGWLNSLFIKNDRHSSPTIRTDTRGTPWPIGTTTRAVDSEGTMLGFLHFSFFIATLAFQLHWQELLHSTT